MDHHHWKSNKVLNDRIRELAAKHSHIPLDRKDLEKLLFYAAALTEAHYHTSVESIPEYNNWKQRLETFEI